MLSVVGVIPARYESSRLPGKALVDLQGKPLLYHVFTRSRRAQSLQHILIATDDERIRVAAEGFGAEVVMTASTHRSGTDRIAEAVRNLEAEIIVNIQGDEPLIDFHSIDLLVSLLQNDPDADMSTLMTPISTLEDLRDPNVVKVVTDEKGYALYFSRASIPYSKNVDSSMLKHYYGHIGLYAFRRDFLMKFTSWPPSTLEKLESLEQLRALEHGAKIKVGLIHDHFFGVDTPEDLERIRRLVEGNSKILQA